MTLPWIFAAVFAGIAVVEGYYRRKWTRLAQECLRKYEFAVALTEAMGEELDERPNVVVLQNEMSMN